MGSSILPLITWQLALAKLVMLITYVGEKIASSTNGVGETGYPHVED
jgi:hypothetical protein